MITTTVTSKLSDASNHKLVFLFKKASRFVAILVVLASGLVLIGWWLDILALKSVSPSLVAMKPNAAFAFILAGMLLWLKACPIKEPRSISHYLLNLNTEKFHERQDYIAGRRQS